MNFKKRIGAGILAGALAVSTLFTGCSEKINENAVLVKVGDEEHITLGYYYFAAKYQQAVYDINYSSMLGDEMWTNDLEGSETPFQETVKQNVLDDLKDQYLAKQHAEEYGIKLTADDEKKIDEAAKSFMDSNDKKALEQMGATEEYVKEYLTGKFYLHNIENIIKSETEVSVSDEDANQTTITYALFSTAPTTDEESGESVEKTDEEKAELQSKAEALVTAEDFDAAAEGAEVKSYTYTTASNPADDTSVGEQVIAAANALNDGERSGVIAVEGEGYYVVRMDKKYDDEQTATKRKSLEDEQRQSHYDDVKGGWAEGLAWEVDEDNLAQVVFDPMFEISESMRNTIMERTSGEE